MEIRKYRQGEEEELWRLFYNTIHQVNIQDYDEQQVAAWAPDNFDVNEAIQRYRNIDPFVVVHDGRIVAYADIQPDGYIEHFFCHHAFQGQGVGKALFATLESEARANGIADMYANVSITARPFFQAMGFSVDKEQLVDLRGQQLRNYRMVRQLSLG